MKVCSTLFIISLLTSSGLTAGTIAPEWTKVEVQRLPDLNVPRASHATFCFGDEIVVMGGHTLGFVPTATAEYLADGHWHQMPMTYTHDQGFSLLLSSGKVIIGGGHEQNLGIGQTYTVESYDPATHTYEGFGCLDTKRCFADAVELDSGKVVITGNWYHTDDVEIFDGNTHFTHLKGTFAQRACPSVFRVAKDDAIIFSPMDIHGERTQNIIVERLRGDTIAIPLFDTWRPLFSLACVYRSADSFIGDESRDEYAYLFLVEGGDGEGLAIARLQGTQCDLLPTIIPLPQTTPWDTLQYVGSFVADRHARRAYMLLYGAERLYVICVDYGSTADGHAAPVTLYYTDPIRDLGRFAVPVITPEGDLVVVGGIKEDNFRPSATALRLCLAAPSVAAQQKNSHWAWIIVIIAVVGILLLFLLLLRRRRSSIPASSSGISSIPASPTMDLPPTGEDGEELDMMERICRIMEAEQLYLKPDLKITDVAAMLGVSPRIISNCIKADRDTTFVAFVNTYRVERVKALMRQEPNKKTCSLWREAGFAHEASFFRTFKSVTGTTPREWLQKMEQTDLTN